MTPYELPDVVEGMTPDAARHTLDRIYAQVAQDAQHPYTNSHSPLHTKMVERVHALHEVWAQRPPDETVFDRALAERDARQESLQAEAEAEMSALADLGYEVAPVPDDVPEHVVRALRMQRLAAQKDFDTLGPLADAQISRLTNPATRATLWTCLSDFRQAQKSRAPDLNVRAERLVEKVARATAKQYAGPSKPGAITEPVDELEGDDDEL